MSNLPAERARGKQGWQSQFNVLLPGIQRYAEIAFCDFDPEERSEAIQDTVVAAMLAYVALHKQGRQSIAYATVLAKYAVLRYFDNRRYDGYLPINDALSPHARVEVERLGWREVIVEDRHSTPADIAAIKIDFACWLETLSNHRRKIAETLAIGETTNDAAKLHKISAGRISQIRRQLMESWFHFQGEELVT